MSPTPSPSGQTAAWRRGVRLGIDVGDVRVGIAQCDADGLLATPVETIPRGTGDVERILALVDTSGAVEIVVGLPRLLSGGLGAAAEKAMAFATAVAEAAARGGRQVPVRLVDERLTTVSAERVLRERGKKGAARRAVVDQAAAVVILQHAIDSERSRGRPPGQEVGHW
ncbi:MAG: Holliday junction resolvase RuvX [Nocardioidaceae bacterium]